MRVFARAFRTGCIDAFLAALWISFLVPSHPAGAGPSNGDICEDPEACFLKGIAAYREARYEEAIPALEKSLSADTGWEEYPYFYLIESHWKSCDVPETLGLCKQFQSRFPKSPLLVRVARVEADAFVRAGAPSSAARAYENLIRTHDSGDLRLAYGQVLESVGRLSDAHHNYQAVRKKWPRSASSKEARLRATRIEKALPRMKERLRTDQGLLEEADLCLLEGECADAVSLFSRLLSMRLSTTLRERVMEGSVQALVSCGRLDEAHDRLSEMLESYPKSPGSVRSTYTVARGYWSRDRNSDATPLLERILRRAPDSPEAARAGFVLGRICVEGGDFEGGIQRFRETRFEFPGTEWERESAWWEAWCRYRRGDYATGAALLERFDTAGTWVPEQVPRSRYWQARSLERAGQRATSRAVYKHLVQDWPDNYYCLLARNRMRGEYVPSRLSKVGWDAPAPEASQVMADLSLRLQDPALAVLQEAGLRGDLVGRLNWLRSSARGKGTMSAEDWVRAYCLANDLPGAVSAARDSGVLDRLLSDGLSGRDAESVEMLRLLYPLPYRDLIWDQAGKNGLDPCLVAGLIRQESLFRPDAVSSAGAVGLMQIMPATASAVAARAGIDGFDPSRLVDPEVNIRIGTAYLAELRERNGTDWHKILATYNAGPTAVGKWTAAMPDAEWDEFVENILYLETRLYVRKVLFNWDVYRHFHGLGRQ